MLIQNSIEIKSAPEKVFYWLEDPERAMNWQTNVSRYEILKETPIKVGTTFTEYIEENGKGTEMRGVVTDFVSNKRMAFHLEGDYNSVDVDFILEERDGNTLLTQNAKLQFKGMFKVLIIFIGSSIRKKIINQTKKEFAMLKKLCEGDQ